METFIQHPGKAIDPDARFAHVMAITLDPTSDFKRGTLRCITSREGEVDISGYIDRSVLHHVHQTGPQEFAIGERLEIKNQDSLVASLTPDGYEFLGLEDPDIIFDSEKNLLHLYFTIPLVNRAEGRSLIYLGHAEGTDLDSLIMREPVLRTDDRGNGAKEVSIVPCASDGIRRNLVESSAPGFHPEGGFELAYSTVRLAYAEQLGDAWKFGETLFHPANGFNGKVIDWAGGHASPGPFMPRTFIDVGEGKLLGFMNGREANMISREQVVYGMFSVGLYIYDYEKGVIDWISPEPFIRDTEANTITFASQFVEEKDERGELTGTGTLYAHVDDSFVRAYTINANALKALIL
jgi:hypothetical protein